jgi:hypothetical protein
MIKEAIFRVTMRTLMPGLAKQLEMDDALRLEMQGADEGVRNDDCILIEDRGADTTIFVLSGIDALFAGMARFEFRKLFDQIGQDYNLVFVRDIRRMTYHVTPEGGFDGLAFHAKKINEAMEQLGAQYNVVIGSSGGASAAFHFGVRCEFDHIIAFSPAFREYEFTHVWPKLRLLLDLRLLLKEPSGYLEGILVLLAGSWTVYHRNHRVPGAPHWNPIQEFEDADSRPTAMLFFGEDNYVDRNQYAMGAHMPEITAVRLPTGRHNIPAVLKKRGELDTRLREAIGAGRDG